MYFKKSPTLVPIEDFDKYKEAKALHNAMKGIFGPNNNALLEILAQRCNSQRMEILDAYKELYNKDIKEQFKTKLHGDFKGAMITLTVPILPDFYIKELHYAMKKANTVQLILLEILCTLSNHEIDVLKSTWQKQYGKSLENVLKQETSGVFTRLMVALCRGERDESAVTDRLAAEVTANKLFETGAGRLGTDESVFIRVFCYRNIEQLKLIAQCYEELSGHSLENAIKSEFSGDSQRVLLSILQLAKDPTIFFAQKLNESMKGLGTNDRQLIRLVTTRSEIDMGDIKKVYEETYNESLAHAIRGDCSGNYKKCLLALIGERHLNQQKTSCLQMASE